MQTADKWQRQYLCRRHSVAWSLCFKPQCYWVLGDNPPWASCIFFMYWRNWDVCSVKFSRAWIFLMASLKYHLIFSPFLCIFCQLVVRYRSLITFQLSCFGQTYYISVIGVFHAPGDLRCDVSFFYNISIHSYWISGSTSFLRLQNSDFLLYQLSMYVACVCTLRTSLLSSYNTPVKRNFPLSLTWLLSSVLWLGMAGRVLDSFPLPRQFQNNELIPKHLPWLSINCFYYDYELKDLNIFDGFLYIAVLLVDDKIISHFIHMSLCKLAPESFGTTQS